MKNALKTWRERRTAAADRRSLAPPRRSHPEAIVGPFISILIHCIFLMIAAVILVHDSPPSEPAEGIEIELANLSFDELTDLPQSPFEAADSPLDSLLDDETEEPAEMFEAESQAHELTWSDSAPLETFGGAGDSIDAGGALGGGGSAGGTSFFGIESRGHRFMYIVDISGSMSSDNRIGTLKRELINSIDALAAHASFFVLAYNSRVSPINHDSAWRKSDRAAKLDAIAWIQKLGSSGGTVPLPAFESALRFKPRPDVIYFMTDGQGIEGLPTVIAGLNNRGRKTRIYTIAFGNTGSEQMMKQIARESGGTYRFVPSGGGP